MAALALTVLLAILWVACIAFGYRHGGWRQVVLLAAMLLAYAVASEWAIANGHDLSARFHWVLARTTTTVALLYLLVGTVLLGVMGSFALYRPRPLGATERGLGAVMGILNGGLLLALVLRTLRSYAFVAGRGETLQTSVLSRLLIEDVGYLLLAALLLGGIAAVVGIVATRRDDAREIALLASVGPSAIAMPAAPRNEEHPTAPTQPVPRPPVTQPTAPPASQPVYATAPLIDWPANPPPGIQLAPSAVGESLKPAVSPLVASAPDTPPVPAPLPARPHLPPRVPPPMVYPVTALIAVQTAAVMHEASAPSLAASSPTPSAASVRSARPGGPPPGAVMPESPLLAPVPEPSSSLTHEADPRVEEMPTPVVREAAVTMHDVPALRNNKSASEGVPDETRGDMEGGTMPTEIPATPPPNTTMATAAIPTIHPPLPPMSVPRPAPIAAPSAPKNAHPVAADRSLHEAAGAPRAGYARVAVPRQASSRPDESPPSQPQPSAPPEPLRLPLPTGPRVHPCPACGYPVRDHARYCPNCGSLQRHVPNVSR